ncbi:MAG: hypothetical protein ACE15E_06010 [Acidobacteriota bacterium]
MIRLNCLSYETDDDTGSIHFRDSDGKPTAIPVGGTSQASLNFSLDPFSVLEYETGGQGQLKSGSVSVVSNDQFSRLEASEVFDVLGNFVSLDPSPNRTVHQVYVSFTPTECTGIAAYNPSSEAIKIDAFLLSSGGEERADTVIHMAANQQFAVFIDGSKLFATYFSLHPEEFQGTLNLRVRDSKKVAIVGLIQKKQTGALIAIASGDKAFSR